MRKRILFVIDGLAGGGAERIVLRLSGYLTRQGHVVAIANLRDEQELPVPNGVELIRAFDRARARLRKVNEVRRRARWLDRSLAGRGPWDLVISTLAQTDRIVARSSVAEEAWYRVANPPSVQHLDGHRGLKRSKRLHRLRRTYEGRKVIAISSGVAEDLLQVLEISPSRIETIYNPFDVSEIRGLAAEPCSLAGEDYLVHVGRFDPQKRHDRLLGAFVKSAYRGRLVLVGTGPAARRREIETTISSLGLGARVEWARFQVNPYPYIRHARALVLSSDYEGFGSVLVEALICGTPAVSTRCPSGPAEILTDGLSVGLADLSEWGLAAAIDRVIADPPQIDPASYERFAIETIADQYLQLAT